MIFVRYYVLISLILLILCIIGFYILPISLAIGLRNRNKIEGRCQCKFWLKCASAGFGSIVPILLIIICGFSIVVAFVYYTIVAVLLNSDTSNFEEKEIVNDQGVIKVVPPPMGETYLMCISNGYFNKSYLLKSLFDIDDDNDVVNSSSNENENQEGNDNGDNIEDEDDIFATILERIKEKIANENSDFIKEIIACNDNGSSELTTNIDKMYNNGVLSEDSAYLNKYGTFLSSLNIEEFINVMLDAILDRDTIQNVLKYNGFYYNDPYDTILYTFDQIIEGFYHYFDDLRSYLSNILTEDGIGLDAFNDIDKYKENLEKIYSVIKTADENSDENDYSFTITNDMVDIGNGLCKAYNILNKKTTGGNPQNFRNDLKTVLDSCSNITPENGTWGKVDEEVKLQNYTFRDLLEVTSAYLDSKLSDEKEIKDTIDEYIKEADEMSPIVSKLIEVINIAEKVVDDFKGLKNDIQKYIDDMECPGNTCLDNYSVYNKQLEGNGNIYPAIDALIGLVRNSAADLKDKALNINKYSIKGLLSCYPLGTTSDTVTVVFNRFSKILTILTISLLFLIIGCMLMTIVSNMGPIVYHDNYLYKFCCCCYRAGFLDAYPDVPMKKICCCYVKSKNGSVSNTETTPLDHENMDLSLSISPATNTSKERNDSGSLGLTTLEIKQEEKHASNADTKTDSNQFTKSPSFVLAMSGQYNSPQIEIDNDKSSGSGLFSNTDSNTFYKDANTDITNSTKSRRNLYSSSDEEYVVNNTKLYSSGDIYSENGSHPF